MKTIIILIAVLMPFLVTGQSYDVNGDYKISGNVGIGTTSPSNIGNWNRVLNVHGNEHSKILTSSNTSSIRTGIFSNSSWYGANGFVGTETNHNLHLITGYSLKMTILTNGDVGIGTITPEKKLDVNGDILLKNSSGIKQIYTWEATDDNWRIGMNSNPGFTRSISTSQVQYLTYASGTTQGFAVGVNGGNSSFEIRGSDHMAFFRGDVGLGTTSTGSHKLAVEGSIGAREIRVEAIGWSDFVFEKDYKLRTLEQVEQHINEKGHLPEIPSEVEVTENGINLGEMNAKLLQKIEELTLYVIEQNKELKTANQKIEELQKEFSALKKE